MRTTPSSCQQAALTRMYTALFQGSWAIELMQLHVIDTERKQLWLALWAFNIHLRSGATYSGRDIGTFRLRDGLIREHAEYFDPLGFAQAYGMTPSPGPARET
jgi:ketosteroid isomerase-like protein